MELLVALTLTSGLAVLAAKLLLSATLQLRDRSERMAGEHALRVAAAAFLAALEPLGQDAATGSDLSAMGPALLRARATRAAGVLCAAVPGRLIARAGPTWWSARRDPVEGRDSILVARPADTSWRAFALSAPPGPASCPDGSRGMALPVPADSLALAGIGPGSPLRVFEHLELRLYSSAPDQWVGLRLLATAQAIQPFAGPMSVSGLGLNYLRRDGSAASLPSEVAAAQLRLAVLTERAGGVGMARGGSPRRDSVTVFVALWNAR